MTKFIRLKAVVLADEGATAETLDYNVNIAKILVFGETMATGGFTLPEGFKGSIIVTDDGARTMVEETPRKVRSLIAEATGGNADAV